MTEEQKQAQRIANNIYRFHNKAEILENNAEFEPNKYTRANLETRAQLLRDKEEEYFKQLAAVAQNLTDAQFYEIQSVNDLLIDRTDLINDYNL